jgi:ABC-2 type transport system ATP-binding protein
MAAIIEADSVSKRFRQHKRFAGFRGAFKTLFTREYDEVAAVDGISFSIQEGEAVGYLGPNGAGKSTMIKMLTGQMHPRSGHVAVLGGDPTDQATQARIGVCFEEKNLYLAMSAVENLVFFSRLFGIRGFDPMPLLEKVGLAANAKDRVNDFSKGMRQRLMVARSLINRPDVLFLDEPTDGLDPVSVRTIQAVIREESDRGAAILLTTHDMHEADTLSDRVAFINQGKLLAVDAPEALKLEHGKRSVRVRYRTGEEVSERVIPLDGVDAAEQMRRAISTEGLLTIHTEEASLEDIFVLFAGRGLDA